MRYERRYNLNTDLTADDRDTMHNLIRNHGHDPTNIAPTIAITQDLLGTQLHLSEYLRDRTGLPAWDVAAGHDATRPHVHDIHPDWLPPTIRPAHAHADSRH